MPLWIKIGVPIAILAMVSVVVFAYQGAHLEAVGIAVIGIVTVGFTRWSLIPLEDVTRVVEGIARGHLHHDRVDESRNDEVGRLARATNKMTDQLSDLSKTAERLARGDIGVVDVEQRVLDTGRLEDADLPFHSSQGDLERNFVKLTNQMRRLTIQARIIAGDDLYSPLLDEPVPGELGDAFALMVRNLRTIADRAQDIAEGDLTTYVDGEGDLTTAFNQMVTGLNDLVQRIVETAIHISSASEEILLVLQDQELAASHQASGVEETQRTMETLLASARKIADNSKTVFKSAEKTQANNRTVAERIGELKSHTARIAEILEVIKSIADRSDLLALNASLEGMRAGEAGKGFTLVAAEMRRLAENIKESIGDIKELVSDIRESSLATVMATEEGSRLSEQTTDTALQISLITQQQQSGTEQVTQSMEELSHLINQGVAGTRQVTTAARELADASDNLRFLVDEFEVVGDAADSAPATSSSLRKSEPRRAKASRKSRRTSASSSAAPTTRDDQPSSASVEPSSTLTRSKKFAQMARRAQVTPSNFGGTNGAHDVDLDADTGEYDDLDADPLDDDSRSRPTLQFTAATSDNSGLFDDIPGLRNKDRTDTPSTSQEFEAIAREIESTEIQADADPDEEDSESS